MPSFAEWIADVRANAEARRREPAQVDDLAEIRRRLEEMRAASTPARTASWLPDRMPTREQLQTDIPTTTVHVGLVHLHTMEPRIPDRRVWTWWCTCHPGVECAAPWAEKPALSSAVAEHDLTVGGRKFGVRSRGVR